jgi:hypothetical protein
MATLHELLAPSVVNRVISQLKTPQSRLQRWFGFQIGGPNVNPIGGRYTSYDIFDRTRTIAKMRAPGTGPASTSAQVVGRVPIVIARAHEKMNLDYERLNFLRMLGMNAGNQDDMGKVYLRKQEEHLAQRFTNFAEYLTSRMLRGSFQVVETGDDWVVVDTGGTFTIDYQVPAGNKSQLDMLGAGSIIGTSWDNAAAPIFQNLMDINGAFEQQHGRPLAHVWCSGKMWRYVITNTQIQAIGGTANTGFAQFDRVPEAGPDGININEFVGVLRAVPWLQWHIYDAGLDVNGTFAKFFPDDVACFLPEPGSDWTEMLLGSEPIVDDFGMQPVQRTGFYAWTRQTIEPSGVQLSAIHNALPALYVPKCVAYATSKF